MISNPNHDEQRDEVELLSNILFDKIEILESFPFYKFQISITLDDHTEEKPCLLLIITYHEDYPCSFPKFTLDDPTNTISSTNMKRANELILQSFSENQGMPMIYQCYEQLKVY